MNRATAMLEEPLPFPGPLSYACDALQESVIVR
jgi:hypothetical protein